jgi:hypothetical protein
MSANDQKWTTFSAGLYWIGMISTVTCLGFIIAGNTELLYRFEHTPFPLSWAFAGLAVLAFLAAELCGPTEFLEREAQVENTQFVPEWEAVEAQR